MDEILSLDGHEKRLDSAMRTSHENLGSSKVQITNVEGVDLLTLSSELFGFIGHRVGSLSSQATQTARKRSMA